MNNYQLNIIQRSMENPTVLSEWEYDFIEDMNDRGELYEVSEKQNGILNRIDSKLTRENR